MNRFINWIFGIKPDAGPSMDEIVKQINAGMAGYIFVEAVTYPTAHPGTEQALSLTLQSPDDGTERRTVRKTITFANITAKQVIVGQ